MRRSGVLLTFTALLIATLTYAQSPGGPGGPPPPPGGGPTDPFLPIDGGLTALLVAGGALGYKKYKEHSQLE